MKKLMLLVILFLGILCGAKSPVLPPSSAGLFINTEQVFITQLEPAIDYIFITAQIKTQWVLPHFWQVYICPVGQGNDGTWYYITSGYFDVLQVPHTQRIRFTCKPGTNNIPHGVVYGVKIIVYNNSAQKTFIKGIFHL